MSKVLQHLVDEEDGELVTDAATASAPLFPAMTASEMNVSMPEFLVIFFSANCVV